MGNPTKNDLPITHPQGTDTEMLEGLQKDTFDYFIDDKLCKNGLVADKNKEGFPASIAVMGLALATYVTGIERKYISRKDAGSRTLSILNRLYDSHQGIEIDATGYKGFYYHFLEMETGKRAFNSELSTIDTAILMAGILTSVGYFKGENEDEKEIRILGDALYKRVDWQWALNGKNTFSHGWTPENGFIEFRWDRDYSEAHILYILAMGSPTFPIGNAGYKEWISTFQWKKIYETEYLYAGPLFIHQSSHIWLDFREIQDDFNKKQGLTYFENSKRAVDVQVQYAIENPLEYDHYHKYAWGFSASDGPGPATLDVNGVLRVFDDYIARGAPFGPDDGTVSPWAAVASLPFAPEIVLDTIRHSIEKLQLKKPDNCGFSASFNGTFPEKNDNPFGWVSPWQFGLNQGPVVLMIENYWTGLIWNILRDCPYIIKGLKEAGFTGGWLDEV